MALFRRRTWGYGIRWVYNTAAVIMALGRQIALVYRRIVHLHQESINDELHIVFELVLPYDCASGGLGTDARQSYR
jgi:hypothetical protein